MTNECCIPNCKNTQKTEKYTLFWAPKDNHQRKKWENIIPRKGPLRQTHRVCALHFQEQDVIKGKTVIINGKKNFYQYHPMQWKLRPGALPRIFPASIFDGISQRSPRSYQSPLQQQPKSPNVPVSQSGRRSTRSMTDEDFVASNNRPKIYSYDFESDRASEILDDIDSEESSSDYSDWTAESSERMWTPIPAKRARLRISNPMTLNNSLSLPAERLRPSDLLTPVIPRRTPFQPQMGDEVIYFRQGHELYVDAVNQQKHVDVHLRSLPWLNEQELVKIIGIKYDIKLPHRLFCLKLRLTPDPDSGQETKSGVLNGGSFTVKYHNVEGVPDFLVLKQYYDWAIRRDWQPGERFRTFRNDSWHEGQIEMREPFSTHCPNSLFLCYRIRLENGQMERLSPWDMHETIKKTRGRPRSVNKTNPPGSIDCHSMDSASYKPQILDWPPVGDMDFECDRISNGISKIMNLTAAKPFTSPVNLEEYPLYVFVVKYPPMDLSTVKSRLDNRFYRRLAAVQYDIRTICSNAFKFNEPNSDIVRNASIISDLCLEVIRNRDSTDAITAVYQQLVEKYKSQTDEIILENTVTVAKECVQPAPTTPRSNSRLNTQNSQPEQEVNGIVASKSMEKKIPTPRSSIDVAPSSNDGRQSTTAVIATAVNPADNTDKTVASYSNNSCTCSIDVVPEDKVQYLNEKEQLDVDIENRFRTLVTTIESELHKERNLLSEQKQKIVALRAAISQQRREETVRPDNQWPEIFKLTRLMEEREKVHSPLVLLENKKLTQEMTFLEQQIVVKKLQVELNLMDAKDNPQKFHAIEKKLEENKLLAKQMENNLKPVSDELSSLKQKEKDLDRQISELKANFNNLLATMEVIATSIQNQISNMDTKKKDMICNLKERIHASKMLEMKLIKIAYQESMMDSQKKAEEKLNKLNRLTESDPLELDAIG